MCVVGSHPCREVKVYTVQKITWY